MLAKVARSRLLVTIPRKRIVWQLPALFSSQKGPRLEEDEEEQKSSAVQPKMFSIAYFQQLAWKNPNTFIIGGSVVGVMGISNLLYMAGHYFMTFTPASALYYGFGVGAFATTCAAAGAFLVHRSFRFEPDTAVYLALSKIKQNKDLLVTLGGRISPSEVKAYSISNSGISLVGTTPKVIHPKMYVVFHLVGGSTPAVVTAVCTKIGLFEHKCEYVSVDWTNPSGQILSLAVEGDDTAFVKKNAVRAHVNMLSTKSPKYR